METLVEAQLRPGLVVGGFQGKYILKEFIDDGSFSKVFTVTTMNCKHEYAMKLVYYQLDAIMEANILLTLNGLRLRFPRYICKLKDFVQLRRQTIGLVLEKGSCSLLQVMEANGMHPLPVRHIRDITYQLLCALESLHEWNVVHVDVKPENILLQLSTRFFWKPRNDTTQHVEMYKPTIMLCDFNCSKYVPSWDNNLDTVQTFHYRAPEIPLGLKPDVSVDVFSAGAIMAELVCGQVVFDLESKNEQSPNEVERAKHIHLCEMILGKCPETLTAQSPLKFFNTGEWRLAVAPPEERPHFLDWRKSALENGTLSDKHMIDVINTMLTWPGSRSSASLTRKAHFFKDHKNKDHLRALYSKMIEIRSADVVAMANRNYQRENVNAETEHRDKEIITMTF